MYDRQFLYNKYRTPQYLYCSVLRYDMAIYLKETVCMEVHGNLLVTANEFVTYSRSAGWEPLCFILA
jgi:hypothetical protein